MASTHVVYDESVAFEYGLLVEQGDPRRLVTKVCWPASFLVRRMLVVCVARIRMQDMVVVVGSLVNMVTGRVAQERRGDRSLAEVPRDLGRGSDLWILHTATEVAFTDEDGQPGHAFEWSVWWVKGVGVK